MCHSIMFSKNCVENQKGKEARRMGAPTGQRQAVGELLTVPPPREMEALSEK